jgi:hypothetical protein
VHILAVNFEGEEQVFVRGVRVNAELGEIAEKTFAGVAQVMREGVFCGLKERLEFGAMEFGHGGLD